MAMSGGSEAAAARHRDRLEAFVLRARRVEAHSLAADWAELVALTEMKMSTTLLPNGEARVRQDFPAEELVESAAARIRPILLTKDDCFYQNAMAGLAYFCRTWPDDLTWIRATRAEWRARVDPASPDEAGYWLMLGNMATGEKSDLDRHKLAMAWIYGEVVHHDTQRRREAEPFGLFERFRAAVPLIAWTMVGTIELLNYVRALQNDGVLQLSENVFEEQVVLTTTVYEVTGRIYAAPAGTSAPTDALAPLSQEWSLLAKEADLPSLIQRPRS
ncbi:hypothetical protein [Streptomyces sp. NPDC056069]|uniref:hypothetical protein n=1 Tax=Streptomyces sp. NPDC056069 TaxID=3345702 RepID=UPI0035DBDB13